MRTPKRTGAPIPYRFEVWQGGLCVAEGSGPDRDAVLREARHYAMMYTSRGMEAAIDAATPLPDRVSLT